MIWGLSLHGWEDVMRGSLAIVGVFGLLVGLSTFFVVTLQREEIAESAKLLDEYKSDAGERIASADAAGKAAQADAAQAVAETARANERTALLEREAAQARAEQERLKATMAWRRITAAQFETLDRILRGHPMKVWVSSLSDDPEARTFRDDIDRSLKAAGVTTQYFTGYAMAVGLSISDTPTGPERDLLMAAFKEAGLPLGPHPQNMMPNELELVVGSKPPPF